MKNLLNRKLFELFELFDKKVRNYSLFDKFLNPYLNPDLDLFFQPGKTTYLVNKGVKDIVLKASVCYR
jgi:hypothetical protein